MKQDIICILITFSILLPGELALVTYIMMGMGQLNLINFLCWVGAFMTINSIIGAAFSSHVSEQKQTEKQQERIEDS